MREKNQWLAAFAGSGLVHIALLFLLGSFAGGLLVAVPAEEKYIEIELFAPPAGSGGQAGIVKAAAAAPREPDSGPAAHAAASAVAREAAVPLFPENLDSDAVPASIVAGPAAGLPPGPAAGQGSNGGAGAAVGGAGLAGGSGAPAAAGTGQGSGIPARFPLTGFQRIAGKYHSSHRVSPDA